MTEGLAAFTNKFAQTMSELKRLCSSPSRISLVTRNSVEGRKLVLWLYDAEYAFRAWQEENAHLLLDAWFVEHRQTFVTQWWDALSKVANELDLEDLFRDGEGSQAWPQISEDEWIAISSRRRPSLSATEPWQDLVLGYGEVSRSIADTIELYYTGLEGDPGASTSRAGQEAWDFLCHNVKIDFDGIERRWLSLPRVQLSSQFKRSSPLHFHSSVRLLDDANRSYLFGCHAASLAICRALTEHLITNVYLSGVTNGWKLRQLIAKSSSIYPEFERLALQALVRHANSFMHDSSTTNWDLAESVNLKFLMSCKSLIEDAPKLPASLPSQ